MSIPLSVRLGERNISAAVEDLQFRKNVHGTSEVNFNLTDRLDRNLPPYERVWVYDGVSADSLAEGRVEEPGRSTGTDGQRWDVATIGEQARTRDRAVPYILIDSSYERWVREQLERATSAEAGPSEIPSLPGTDGLVMQYNPGQPIDNNSTILMAYHAIEEAGMRIGGIEYTAVSALNTPGGSFAYRMWAVDANGDGTMLRVNPYSTTPVTRYATLSDATPLPAGTVAIWLTAKRVSGGATMVRTDNNWAAYYNLVVKAARYNLDGTLNTTNADYQAGRMVYPHEVVTDLLARLLGNSYDGPNADIDTSSTYGIDQLAYPDGVTAEQVLEDLMGMVPGYYWQVGPSDPVTGKASFTWRQWPTHVRYEISYRDGLDLPGSDAERYNRVTFRWKDSKGVTRTKSYEAGTSIAGVFVPDVPELAAAGPGGTRLIREPEIQDLADELGSQANADKAAAEFLLEHGTPPASGTLTVSHKVYDNDQGRYVQPWELEPGHLAQVPELADSPDDLTVAGRDGKSVFRVVGMTYQTSQNAAELELDAPPRTDENLLAEQLSTRTRKQ